MHARSHDVTSGKISKWCMKERKLVSGMCMRAQQAQ